MKRIGAAVLALVLCLGLLSGCGGTQKIETEGATAQLSGVGQEGDALMGTIEVAVTVADGDKREDEDWLFAYQPTVSGGALVGETLPILTSAVRTKGDTVTITMEFQLPLGDTVQSGDALTISLPGFAQTFSCTA